MHLDLFVSRRHLRSFTFTVNWNCTRDSPKIVQQAGDHLLWRPVQLIVCTFVPLKDRHASAPAASLYPCLWTGSQQWKPEMRKAHFQVVLSLEHPMCRKWRNISEDTWFTFKFLQTQAFKPKLYNVLFLFPPLESILAKPKPAFFIRIFDVGPKKLGWRWTLNSLSFSTLSFTILALYLDPMYTMTLLKKFVLFLLPLKLLNMLSNLFPNTNWQKKLKTDQ